MSGKKILLLLEYTQTGGTRTYAKQLIEFYYKNGFELNVLADGPEHDPDMSQFCDQKDVSLKIYEAKPDRSVFVKSFPFKLFDKISTINSLVKSLKPDLIVASVGAPGLYMASMGLVKRSVYILHSRLDYDLTLPRWKHLIYRWMVLFFIPKACRLVTVSNYAAKTIRDNWTLKDDKQSTIIYNCSGDLVSGTKKKPTSFNILAVGHVVEYKNPMFWIEIARLVIEQKPEITFTWVGDGLLLDVCREYVQSLGLSGNIQFVGKRINVSEFYENCDIYVHPSRVESFGIAVLDAMRYGKPSIVSQEGGLPEIIKDDVSGYVIDLDLGPKCFAKHILELANNEDLRSKLGRSAQRAYIETFSPQAWEQKMLTLHREILSK